MINQAQALPALVANQPLNQNSLQKERFLFVTESIATIGLLFLAVLALAGKLEGTTLYGTSIALFAGATLCNFAKGHLYLRRVELLTNFIQLAGFLFSIGCIAKFAAHSSYATGSVLISLLSISILFNGVQLLSYYSEKKKSKALSQLENRTLYKMSLPSSLNRRSTTGSFISNSTILYKKIANEEFSVITFNTACMPPWISKYIGKMRPPAERARQIIEALTDPNHQNQLPYALCLQECFDREAVEILVSGLSTLYPGVLFDVAPFPGKVGQGSGLIFASFMEPSKATFESTYCYASEEALCNKGVLLVKGVEENAMTIANLHLVSRATYEERVEEVEKQVLPILNNYPGSLIVAGDFNLPNNKDYPISLGGVTLLSPKAAQGTFFDVHNKSWEKNTFVGNNQPMDDRKWTFDHIGCTKNIKRAREGVSGAVIPFYREGLATAEINLRKS